MSNLTIIDLAVELEDAALLSVAGGEYYYPEAMYMAYNFSDNRVFNISSQGTSINVGNQLSAGSEGTVFVGSEMVVNNTPVFIGSINMISGV